MKSYTVQQQKKIGIDPGVLQGMPFMEAKRMGSGRAAIVIAGFYTRDF